MDLKYGEQLLWKNPAQVINGSLMFPTPSASASSSSTSNNNGITLQPGPPHLNLIQHQQNLNLQLAAQAAAGISNLRPNPVSSGPHHNNSSNNGTLSAKCMICDKIFPTQTELEHHMKQHQVADGKKPFTCEICSKSFIQSNNLATHMRIHNNEKNYECSYCGKKFSQSNNMKTHQRFVCYWSPLRYRFHHFLSFQNTHGRETLRLFDLWTRIQPKEQLEYPHKDAQHKLALHLWDVWSHVQKYHRTHATHSLSHGQ